MASTNNNFPQNKFLTPPSNPNLLHISGLPHQAQTRQLFDVVFSIFGSSLKKAVPGMDGKEIGGRFISVRERATNSNPIPPPPAKGSSKGVFKPSGYANQVASRLNLRAGGREENSSCSSGSDCPSPRNPPIAEETFGQQLRKRWLEHKQANPDTTEKEKHWRCKQIAMIKFREGKMTPEELYQRLDSKPTSRLLLPKPRPAGRKFSYESNNNEDPDFFTNLYIKNFPQHWQEEDVRNLFQPFGAISSLCVQADASGRKSAFVNLKSPTMAYIAIGMLNGKRDYRTPEQKIQYIKELQSARKNKLLPPEEALLFVGKAMTKHERMKKIEQERKDAHARGEPVLDFNLFLKNLNPKIDETKLREIFIPYGEITSMCIKENEKTILFNPQKKRHLHQLRVRGVAERAFS